MKRNRNPNTYAYISLSKITNANINQHKPLYDSKESASKQNHKISPDNKFTKHKRRRRGERDRERGDTKTLTRKEIVGPRRLVDAIAEWKEWFLETLVLPKTRKEEEERRERWNRKEEVELRNQGRKMRRRKLGFLRRVVRRRREAKLILFGKILGGTKRFRVSRDFMNRKN
ncbi:hypothetical protein AALP_AAs60089U000100 [Arabis alpina]|uniref:Uncharacterized protein n=1 Tax=Arabis alpina TaxID=50452 RepID=A0A087FW85_ARAAL|nr:hypothetical protein AALP_AAs60089U000100 [Arabis alpina]